MPNRFEIGVKLSKIFLNKNDDFTIVSSKRLPELIVINWSISKNEWGNYVHGRIDGKWVYLHRFIMKAKTGEIIDHIDRNRMNNSDDNLRKSSPSNNAYNRKLGKNSSTGVTGVGIDKRDGRYFARIKENYKYKMLGHSLFIEDVIKMRLLYEIEKFGRDNAPQKELLERYGL